MMRRRNLLLIVMVILGLVVTLGLQGCGLLGGGGDEEGEAAEGEAVEGEPADGAEGAPPPMPDEGDMGAPPPEGPGAEGAPPPMGEAPDEGAAAPDGADAEQLVTEAMSAKHDGDYVTAREKLESALEADPDNAEAHRILGWIYAEMAASGQPSMESKAIEHFQTFLEKGGTQQQVSRVEDALDRIQ